MKLNKKKQSRGYCIYCKVMFIKDGKVETSFCPKCNHIIQMYPYLFSPSEMNGRASKV